MNLYITLLIIALIIGALDLLLVIPAFILSSRLSRHEEAQKNKEKK